MWRRYSDSVSAVVHVLSHFPAINLLFSNENLHFSIAVVVAVVVAAAVARFVRSFGSGARCHLMGTLFAFILNPPLRFNFLLSIKILIKFLNFFIRWLFTVVFLILL